MNGQETTKKFLKSQIKMIQEKLSTPPKEGGIYSFDFNFSDLKNQEIILNDYLELINILNDYFDSQIN